MDRLPVTASLILSVMFASAVMFFATVTGPHKTPIYKAMQHKHIPGYQKA